MCDRFFIVRSWIKHTKNKWNRSNHTADTHVFESQTILYKYPGSACLGG